MSDFRCAAASEQRGDDLAGTASTVRSFVLLQAEGPWGRDALTQNRLPEGLGAQLKSKAQRAGVRALLMRQGRTAAPGTRVIAASAQVDDPWLESVVFDDPAAVLDLDLRALARGQSLDLPRIREPVFGVCTHARHDVCCALRGRLAVQALKRVAVGHTWEVSHIGGDRFAGNVLMLPHGLYYGRVDAAGGARIAAAHARGHLDLDQLRGRSSYPMPVQVAEIALRREIDHTALSGLRVLSQTTTGGITEAHFLATTDAAPPASFAVTVSVTASEERYQLTCSAVRDNSIPCYRVLSIQRRPEPRPSEPSLSQTRPEGGREDQ